MLGLTGKLEHRQLFVLLRCRVLGDDDKLIKNNFTDGCPEKLWEILGAKYSFLFQVLLDLRILGLLVLLFNLQSVYLCYPSDIVDQ